MMPSGSNSPDSPICGKEAPGFSRGEELPPSLAFVKDSAYSAFMKLTLQIKLLPERDHARKLQETIERFNEAANWLAGEAFARQLSNKIILQRLFYNDIRQRFGLSAQMAVRCIAQVCEAYRRDKSKRPQFRSHAAMPFDQRMMSF